MAEHQARRPVVHGTHNFRDVGGYRASAGVVRWGKLYRSDALHELTADGSEQLANLGIRRIVDLRKPSERSALPPKVLDPAIEICEASIYDTLDELEVDLWPSFDLSTYYGGLVRRRGHRLASAVEKIATAPGPVLVNCTAGKDRTGVVVALVLSMLGVPRNDIAADYALSEALLAGDWAARMAERFRRQQDLPDTVDPAGIVSGSPASAMLGALELIDDEFGGVAEYLSTHGLAEGVRAQLVDRLVAPNDTAVSA